MSAITNPASPGAQVPKPSQAAPAPEPPKPRSAWKIFALLAVVVIGGFAVYQLVLKQQPAATQSPVIGVPTAKVATGTILQTLRVNGQTSARNFANVIAPMLRGPEANRGLTLLTLVPSGSKVKKGQVIATIDGQAAKDHIDDVTDTVRQAGNDVDKRRAEQEIDWYNLQQTLAVAKADLDKAKLELGAAELRTTIDQELMKLNVEEAEARYNQLRADEDVTKAGFAAELRILELTMERHKRHLERHVHDLDKFTIRTPMDGLAVMTSIWRGGEMGQVKEGDQLSPGQSFMKVVDTSSMQLEASINQAESSHITIGQEATLGLDAFPGLEFKGKVYSINALAVGGWRQNYYIRSVPLRIAIEGSDPRLIPDLSAWADIQIGKEENKPLVPLNAVSREDGKSVVYVKGKDQSFRAREVELGLANATHAAVLKGLEAGEEVRLQ